MAVTREQWEAKALREHEDEGGQISTRFVGMWARYGFPSQEAFTAWFRKNVQEALAGKPAGYTIAVSLPKDNFSTPFSKTTPRFSVPKKRFNWPLAIIGGAATLGTAYFSGAITGLSALKQGAQGLVQGLKTDSSYKAQEKLMAATGTGTGTGNNVASGAIENAVAPDTASFLSELNQREQSLRDILTSERQALPTQTDWKPVIYAVIVFAALALFFPFLTGGKRK